MKLAHIIIAGTLTFNIALTAALVRSNPDFANLINNVQEMDEPIVLKQEPHMETLAILSAQEVAIERALTRSPKTQQYILDTIRTNPDAVIDALIIAQARKAQEAQETEETSFLPTINDGEKPISVYPVVPVYEDYEDGTNAFVGGNTSGDITIVEFFDYNCPHCRAATPTVNEVVKADGNVRVVYREFPILGENSIIAARAALASRKQGLYEEFHNAMMAYDNALTEPMIMTIAQTVGLDVQKLEADMNDKEIFDHIERSLEIAKSFDFNGTPSYIIGGVSASGSPSKSALEGVIKDAREQ